MHNNNEIFRVFNLVSSEIIAARLVYLVGGAVRDTVYGRKPKDYDLAVLARRNDSPERIFSEMETFCSRMSQKGIKTEIFQAYEGSAGSFDERIQGLVKVYNGDVTIDVMWRTEESIYDVLSSFDFNFNQFFISETDASVIHGAAPAHLKQLRFDVAPERIEYINNKWNEYND